MGHNQKICSCCCYVSLLFFNFLNSSLLHFNQNKTENVTDIYNNMSFHRYRVFFLVRAFIMYINRLLRFIFPVCRKKELYGLLRCSVSYACMIFATNKIGSMTRVGRILYPVHCSSFISMAFMELLSCINILLYVIRRYWRRRFTK